MDSIHNYVNHILKTNQVSLQELGPAFQTVDYRALVAQELSKVNPHDPQSADHFFNQHLGITHLPLSFRAPSLSFQLWLDVLHAAREAHRATFVGMHKGTPFFFMAIALYLGFDYPRANHYMTAALTEDRRNFSKPGAEGSAAAQFLLLQDQGSELVWVQPARQARLRLERHISQYNDHTSSAFNLSLLRSYFLRPALGYQPHSSGWQTAAVTLISFILQFDAIYTDLENGAPPGVSMETAFLHLLKGCVLVETLLRFKYGGVSDRKTMQATLKGEGYDLANRLCINISSMETYDASTLEEVLRHLDHQHTNQSIDRVFGITYSLRNQVGHYLGWEQLTVEQYEGLFRNVLTALLWSIHKLY